MGDISKRGKGIGTKETISDAQKAHNFATTSAPIRKDVMPIPKPKRYDQKEVPGDLYNEWDTIIKAPEVPKPIRKRTPIYSDSGPMFKKGGRVTGIAKRGFGRALMKGKR